MTSIRYLLLSLLLFSLGCATDDVRQTSDATPNQQDLNQLADGSIPADDSAPSSPLDPLSFATEVDEKELKKTIVDLEALGTRYTFSQGDEAARDYLIKRFSNYGYEVTRDEFSVEDTTAQNLVFKLPGKVTPETIYVFSAHYDSTSTDPMNNAPGADDNASAVAAVVEAARIFAGNSFRHSLWFVLTAAEEQGSLGSKHLAQLWVEQNIDVRGVIAPDMIGYWPLKDNDLLDILGNPESAELVDSMAAIAVDLGVGHKKWIEHSYCYGDDHTSFQEKGFPSISPMDCVEAHNIPSSGESLPHYHQQTDTFETLYVPFMAKATGVIVATFAKLGSPLGE
jgi:hypothetical protein